MVARLLLRAELRRGLRAHLAVVAMLAGVAAALTLAAVTGRMADKPLGAHVARIRRAAPHAVLRPDAAGLEARASYASRA